MERKSVTVTRQPVVVCPKCGGSMVQKARKSDGHKFWGCKAYPRCNGSRNVENHSASVVTEPKKAFNPSKYQKAIFDEIANGSGHVVVEAKPGSGKTTTLAHGMEYVDAAKLRVAFVAFGKRAANDMAKKVPQGIYVSTTHSLGYADIRAVYPKVVLDDDKVRGIIDGIAKEFNLPEQKPIAEKLDVLGSVIRKVVTLLKNVMLEPTIDSVQYLADNYDIELNGDLELVAQVAAEAYRRSLEMIPEVIDFDDMILVPSLGLVPSRKFDLLGVDECQDLNKCQIRFILNHVDGTGRIIAVGDRYQSIFGFRGADTQAIPNLIDGLKAKVLPLSISYRCPKSHVRLAQTLVEGIEYAENAIEGTIQDVGQGFTEMLADGDVVICRCNAPLVSPAFSLIRRGIKAVILGRDIGQGLIDMIVKVEKQVKSKDLLVVLKAMKEYADAECAKLTELKKTMKAQTLRDKVETIEALSDGLFTTTADLKSRIDNVFTDDAAGVVFSTVHKFKGGEADRVFILNPELMPHPKASEKDMDQERNIKFVAYTRSKRDLFFIRKEM